MLFVLCVAIYIIHIRTSKSLLVTEVAAQYYALYNNTYDAHIMIQCTYIIYISSDYLYSPLYYVDFCVERT